jgi:hypothetical protein
VNFSTSFFEVLSFSTSFFEVLSFSTSFFEVLSFSTSFFEVLNSSTTEKNSKFFTSSDTLKIFLVHGYGTYVRVWYTESGILLEGHLWGIFFIAVE